MLFYTGLPEFTWQHQNSVIRTMTDSFTSKNSSENPHAGHRQRLRERFLRAGVSGFADHELLELLLTYSIPRRDVKDLAKSLLRRFGSLARVLEAPPEVLSAHPGIKEQSTVLLKLVPAFNGLILERNFAGSDVISNPLAAIRYLQKKLGGKDHEVMAVIYLDGKNRVIKCDFQDGGKSSLNFYPQTLAKETLFCGAAGVILAHNHPNGVCHPSEADLENTRKLKNYFDHLELKLFDHLLITKSAHLSLLNRIGCVFRNYHSCCFDPEYITAGQFQK